MMLSTIDAIRMTTIYADIFKFPLTRDELRLWSVYRALPERYFLKKISGIAVWDKQSPVYVTLLRRNGLLSLRYKRTRIAQRKWQIVDRVAWFLRLVPTIQLVGVTGAVAMENADRSDDIDFLLIAAPGTIWITRFLATVLIELVAFRRRPGDRLVTNKICLNMLMTSDALSISFKDRDLFCAHEVLQMKPVWDRNGTYQKFLNANTWVKKFLPTAWRKRSQESKVYSVQKKITFHFSLFTFHLLEPLARAAQLWYMRKHRSTEVVSDTVLRFHPRDARVWIKEKLRQRLASYDVPLDKIFYGR